MDVRQFVRPKMNPSIPQISPGDTIKVSLKTIEGDKERLQHFQGVVIRVRKGVDGGSFTMRRVSYGIGVERTFPFQSTSVQNVEVLRHGKVRRAKLYYMRKLSSKRARLKERRERAIEQAMPEEAEERREEEVESEEERKEEEEIEKEEEEEEEEQEEEKEEKKEIKEERVEEERKEKEEEEEEEEEREVEGEGEGEGEEKEQTPE